MADKSESDWLDPEDFKSTDCADFSESFIPVRPGTPVSKSHAKTCQVALCFGCGGFCKGPEHTPLAGRSFGLFGGLAYTIPSPVHFRPTGLAIWAQGVALIKSIRSGGIEHLAARNVPWQLWAAMNGAKPADIADFARRYKINGQVARIDVGTVFVAETLYIEATEELSDVMIVGLAQMAPSASEGDGL